MADNTMISFGIGLLILGIFGFTLQWNPSLQYIPPVAEFVSKNLGGIEVISIIIILCGLFLVVYGGLSRKKN